MFLGTGGFAGDFFRDAYNSANLGGSTGGGGNSIIGNPIFTHDPMQPPPSTTSPPTTTTPPTTSNPPPTTSNPPPTTSNPPPSNDYNGNGRKTKDPLPPTSDPSMQYDPRGTRPPRYVDSPGVTGLPGYNWQPKTPFWMGTNNASDYSGAGYYDPVSGRFIATAYNFTGHFVEPPKPDANGKYWWDYTETSADADRYWKRLKLLETLANLRKNNPNPEVYTEQWFKNFEHDIDYYLGDQAKEGVDSTYDYNDYSQWQWSGANPEFAEKADSWTYQAVKTLGSAMGVQPLENELISMTAGKVAKGVWWAVTTPYDFMQNKDTRLTTSEDGMMNIFYDKLSQQDKDTLESQNQHHAQRRLLVESIGHINEANPYSQKDLVDAGQAVIRGVVGQTVNYLFPQGGAPRNPGANVPNLPRLPDLANPNMQELEELKAIDQMVPVNQVDQLLEQYGDEYVEFAAGTEFEGQVDYKDYMDPIRYPDVNEEAARDILNEVEQKHGWNIQADPNGNVTEARKTVNDILNAWSREIHQAKSRIYYTGELEEKGY